jgi:hypothetical protein
VRVFAEVNGHCILLIVEHAFPYLHRTITLACTWVILLWASALAAGRKKRAQMDWFDRKIVHYVLMWGSYRWT